MSDNKSVRATRESAIRDQRNLIHQTGAYQCRGWHQHFWQSWTAFWSLVAYHNHVSFVAERLFANLASIEFAHEILLRFAHNGVTTKFESLFAGEFSYAAISGNITIQHFDMASVHERSLDRIHHIAILVRGIKNIFRWNVCYILVHGFASHRHAIAMKQTFRDEICNHRWSPTNALQIAHIIFTRRSQIPNKRHCITDTLKIVQRKLDLCSMRNRQQMQYAIG
mmetsp:Transcript_22767/g.36567  ORF Transcript_22767/g.36567 Transcript_22767/m.36567 type:complete len:224 (-) Transcript_22767:572-1243(-)